MGSSSLFILMDKSVLLFCGCSSEKLYFHMPTMSYRFAQAGPKGHVDCNKFLDQSYAGEQYHVIDGCQLKSIWGDGMCSFKNVSTGWREGSVVKKTWYFCRGSEFDSQHLHGGLQLTVTSVPRGLIPSVGFWGHQTYTWYICIHADEHPYI